VGGTVAIVGGNVVFTDGQLLGPNFTVVNLARRQPVNPGGPSTTTGGQHPDQHPTGQHCGC
jgi:hypothetical protein